MAEKIIIEGGLVFDGTGTSPAENTVVVVEDGTITYVGADPGPTDGAQRIDASGGTVLPGLFDLHLHFCALSPAEYARGLTPETVTTSLLQGIRNARACIETGVTTCRDLGSHEHIYAFRRGIDLGQILGPRLLVSGLAICMTGGHGYNGVSIEADGPAEVMKTARAQLKAGADCIKVMATSGAGSLNAGTEDTQLTVEEMAAAVREAHKKGKRTAAHVNGAAGTLNALAAGVDTIEHGLALDERAVEEMVAAGAYYVPTIWIYREIAERGHELGLTQVMIENSKRVVHAHQWSFKLAIDAGVKIVAGTDAGLAHSPMGVLPRELELMVEGGMSPLDTLVSATGRAAEAAGVSDTHGTLQPGKLADIIIVDGNPIDDIRDIGRTRLTMKGGQILYECKTHA